MVSAVHSSLLDPILSAFRKDKKNRKRKKERDTK
jgi:hypothetical protein